MPLLRCESGEKVGVVGLGNVYAEGVFRFCWFPSLIRRGSISRCSADKDRKAQGVAFVSE